MPETVKYGRCEPSNMVAALGALTNVFKALPYMYNMYGNALKTFKDKTGKVIMEEYNISCFVNLKCEESNH